MVVNEIELGEQLKEAGNRLLNPPPSVDELLNMLDKLEHLLMLVEQAPSRSMQDALLPPMKALISNSLLRNLDADVKVSVASCISEITRITAPDAPYNDDCMKEIFQLIVAATENLSNASSRSYSKAVSILDTIAKVRSCLVMLDLELDELIIKMFRHFFKTIRSHHPHTVFSAMETIMTLIVDESDNISVGLLTSLLASVRKDNQDISPIAWKLGEKVITKCANKLKPYMKEVLHSESIARDDYASIVALICGDELHTSEHAHVNGCGDHLVTNGLPLSSASPGEVFQAVDGISKSISNGNGSNNNIHNDMNNNSSKMLEHCSVIQQSESTDVLCNADPGINLEMEPESVPMKRGRKPNSLMNPEEGYYHSWVFTERKTAKLNRERKPCNKSIDLQSENALREKIMLSATHVTEPVELSPKTGSGFGETHPKRGQAKKNATDTGSLQLPKEEVKNIENEEKTVSEYEVSLRNLSEGRSNEVKQHKHSRKIKLCAKTAEETFLPSAYVSSDEKAGGHRGSKGKPVKSNKVRSRNIGKDGSHRKRNMESSVADVDVNVAEASNVKKIKSSDEDGNHNEEVLKTNLKRKRTPRKEVPPGAADPNFELIDRRIKVWWPLDKMFYNAVVDSYDPTKKKHRVLYEDGDEEILNLKKERWKLIEDDSSDEEVETDIPQADSSDKPQKGNGLLTKSELAKRPKGLLTKSELAKQPKGLLTKSELAKRPKGLLTKSELAKQLKGLLTKSELAKRPKVDSKRNGSRSISKRKARATSSKSSGGTTHDEPVVDNDTDDLCGPDMRGEGGEYQNSNGNLKKITSAGTVIKSEQMTPETASPFSDEC